MSNTLRIVSLQSGSNGNGYFVESGGVRLLFDAGLTGAVTTDRLDAVGVDITSIQGIIISHDHSDHIRGVGVLHRRYGIPVWMTHGTYDRAVQKNRIGRLSHPHLFQAADTLTFGHISVETLATTHDAADGVCFVVDNGSRRLGIMTDLGCRFLGLREAVASLDGVLLESNYDPVMLQNGRYPADLQRRIRSDKGHLSNDEAAELLCHAGKKLRWACLGHLSEENNEPALALKTHRRILGQSFPLLTASRYDCFVLPDLH